MKYPKNGLIYRQMCQKMDTLLSITFESNQVHSLTTNNVALANGLDILAFSKISAKAYKKSLPLHKEWYALSHEEWL